MEDSSFIKIYRKMTEWEWYKDIPVNILFSHLLRIVNYQDKKWKGQIIKKGSVVTGIFSLSEDTGLTVQQIRTAINKLKSTNEITSKSTNSYTIIELTNWEKYQDTITNKITNEEQTNNKRITTTKEGDKGNKNISTDSSLVLGGEESSLTEAETKKKARRDEVISMIDTIKNACISKNIAYSSQDAFKYARLMVLSEEYERCSKMVSMNKEQYSVAILMASIAINYWKGPCTGPRDIYLNHAEIYNQFMLKKEEKGRGSINHQVF